MAFNAVVVTARAPLVSWLEQQERRTGRPAPVPQRQVYVLAPGETLDTWVAAHWESVFDSILAGCLPNPHQWPAPRDVALFRDWFQLEIGAPHHLD